MIDQTTKSALALTLLIATLGCGDDDTSATDAGDDVGADVGSDVGEPMPLAGCEGGECFFIAEVIDVPLAVDGVCGSQYRWRRHRLGWRRRLWS